jgi:hypothetical protein
LVNKTFFKYFNKQISNYAFLVHHPVNWDDWHLLAHAMASDFAVAWQNSQREQLIFRYGSNSWERLNFKIVFPV